MTLIGGNPNMDTQILGWADLGIDIVEVAVIVAVLLVLLRLHRDIDALLRVIRRMDRNTASLTTSAYRGRAKLDEASLPFTRNRRTGAGPVEQPLKYEL